MAKNAPVKKSKRKLKRSVRRSVAAVLMITAIGVAAVPVPENVAAPEGGTTTYANADVHVSDLAGTDTEPGYAYKPADEAGKPLHDITLTGLSDSFKLDVYASKSKDELIKLLEDTTNTPTVHASYAVTNTGSNENPDYSLSWQFLFYDQVYGGNNVGVICKYNDLFYSPEVTLNLYPTTKYFTVESSDITNYFNPDNWSISADSWGYKHKTGENALTVTMDSNMNPLDPVIYRYIDYKNKVEDPIIEKYFKNDPDYIRKLAEFATYEQEKAQADREQTTPPTEPDPFSKAPVYIDESLRTTFFAEYCSTLKAASAPGSSYTLYPVRDGRPGKDGGFVYLARGGKRKEDSIYYEGDFGFLAEEPTKNPMMGIGDKAFSGVTNVKNLIIPGQLNYIGNEAFYKATLLQSITLNNVVGIGNRAFKDCTALTTANLGTSTSQIGQECFSGATHLEAISFGDSTTEIGYGAFYDCESLTTVTFPDGGQECVVGDYAFYDCVALSNVSMENARITKLGDGAFAASAGAQPMNFVLPKNMQDGIGNYLFAGRSSMEYVIFPPRYGASKVVKIPDSVFHQCVSLKYVEFPVDPQVSQFTCGFVNYSPDKLFADVLTEGFYVKGPMINSNGEPAYPRQCTWDAVTAVSNTVPYLYIDNGVEYYEVSDGFYLICINNQGILTSCTFKSDVSSDWDKWLKDPHWAWRKKDSNDDLDPGKDNMEGAVYKNWGGESGKLVIPAMVGNTKVVGIASDCFKDTQLNRRVRELTIEDNSISMIADNTFKGGGGSNNNDWQALEKVYIGNSVNSIGANAFRDCISLVDVTFASPSGGHEAFTIGTDAFKTGSPKLTFHGDIVEGYAPFEWAMSADNTIDPDPTKNSLRVCYISPTYLTVMYNPITEMVTLLDYPKYDEISSILNAAHKDEWEGRYDSYEDMRAKLEYAKYGEEYNERRINFTQRWQKLLSEGSDPKTIYSDTVYYGPWINEDFCRNWTTWVERASSVDQSSNEQNGNPLIDWLFEPITVYAAEEGSPTPVPEPYYKTYPFDIALIVGANDPYRLPTVEERNLVSATRDIVIPAGVESIDVYGYRYNLMADGTPTNGDENSENYVTYLFNTWDNKSSGMYLQPSDADEDGIRSVPGLFSGYYEDGTAAPSETRKRGNDLIQSVTMYTVKYLPDYAFDSCEGLNWVTIGSELKDIGKAPFRGCYALTNVSENDYYTFANGIIYSYNSNDTLTIEECLAARGNLVGEAVIRAFNDPKLTSVSTIREGAFEDCDYLNEIDFGSSDTANLKIIPDDCFKNCDDLQKVTLPKTTNDVKQGAFAGANNLADLTVYGKEVQISAKAFDGDPDKRWTTVHAYEDSAVVRYVGQYTDEYKLRLAGDWLGEIWQVSFYDANYKLIEDLKDLDGNDLNNPQDVPNGERPTTPQDPASTDEWTFERWVGMNNVQLGDRIYENAAFYAQGYTTSGMVNGKYPVTFWDSIDGTQVGPTQNIIPGGDAIAPAHPTHTGYEPNGFSDDYTNIQSPKTILMWYKPTGTSGGGTNTPGTGSGGSTQTPSNSSSNNNSSNNNSSNNTSSNTSSGASTTSSSSDSTATTAGMYTVTVINGSGSGNYAAGATVLIQANTPAAGSVFSKWVTESQGVSLASVSTTPTTFSMPANNVTITAEFTAGTAPVSGTGNTGNAVGTTGNGNTRVDITKPGISNKDLATANVNGSTDNFIVRISETDEATRAVQEALTNKYGSLESLLYYAMDISLYDSTGTYKITDTSGLSVDITIPIPDALVMYGGNNMAGAVINGNQLESLNESFTTINGVPCIRFTATHFSPYTVYVDTGNLTEGMLDTTPKTGDPIHPKWFLSIGLACLSVILFMKKDKAAKVKTA